MNKNTAVGSSFEDFLQEEALYDVAEAVAIKRVIAFQIQSEMKNNNLNKVTLAKTNENQSLSA